MQMAFDEVKATQIAAFFLRMAGGQLKHLTLIKLLYRLDREALRRWNFPVTSDRYVSMKYGLLPAKSTISSKDSANQNVQPTFWSTLIERVGANSVSLRLDPGDTELSPG
jgi:hypothetical protein